MRRRDRVRGGELILLFGLRRAARLVEYFAGRRVPTQQEFGRGLRRVGVVQDWLAGARQDELALRHGVSASTVKRILNRYRRDRYRAAQAAQHARS